jgi:enamine deaminase RidA (YjgF/YER057c/UK114 family)
MTALKGKTAEERLKELGLTLPPPAGAVANYVAWVISNNVVYTSGQLPWIAGDLKFKGKIGRELTPEQGYQACQLSALNAISQLKAATGDLEKVKRILRIEGVLNAAPGFNALPPVLNGASDLMANVFAERGAHTRMIYTNPELPLDCACMVVCWAEISA